MGAKRVKIEVRYVIHWKDGKQVEAATPDSDLVVMMVVKTRRKKRIIAYNANTREAYSIKGSSYYYRRRTEDLKFDELLHLDVGSLEVFDAALAAYINGETDAIVKPHNIKVSPTV